MFKNHVMSLGFILFALSCSTDSMLEPDVIHLSVEKRGYYLATGINSTTKNTFQKYVESNYYVVVIAHNSDLRQDDSIVSIDIDGINPRAYSESQENTSCWPTDNEWLNKMDSKKWCNKTRAEFFKDSGWVPSSIHFKYGQYEERIPLNFPEELKIIEPSQTDSFSLNDDITVRVMGKVSKIYFEFLKNSGYDTSMTESSIYTLKKQKMSGNGVPWGVKIKPYRETFKKISGGTVLNVELFNQRNQGIFEESGNSDLQRTWNVKDPPDCLP